MEQKKLEEMTVLELKATVYDQMAVIENMQNNIRMINQLIAKKSQ